MNAIPFLDIDGVLNTSETYKRARTWADSVESAVKLFEPACVAHLNKITEQTNAQIVVCSAWRHIFTLDELRQIFRIVGIRASVLDVTPTSVSQRARAVIAWLAKHPEVQHWCVLDDDIRAYDNHLPNSNYLVGIDGDVGLTETDAWIAVAQLKR